MKKILFLTTLLGFSTASYADLHFEFKNVNNLNHNDRSSTNNSRVYVCTLQPFRDVFADVGVTQDMARYKVQHRCEKSQGEGSLFCKATAAKCVESSLVLGIDTDRRHGVSIYSQNNQKGESVMITHNVSNLSDYNFDNRMSSFAIPSGWTVRFYEGVNYSGGFYTRNSGDANATGFDNQVSSIKILSTF